MNVPEWLKDLPEAARRIGLDVYRAVMGQAKDESKAKAAALAAVAARFEQTDEGWTPRELQGVERPGLIQFRAGQAVDDKGLLWEVVLIEPGLSLSHPRFYWSEELLEQHADIFEGVDVNAYELTADYFSHIKLPEPHLDDVKRYLTTKKVGWIEKTWWEPGVGVKGHIRFLPEQAWVPQTIRHGQAQGNENVLGLSIDSRIKGMEVLVDDMPIIWATEIVSASSVDVVTRPAAGGKFLRAIQALDKPEEEGTMNKKKFLELIQAKRPDLLKGKDLESISEDEVMTLAQQALEAPAKADPEDGGEHRAQQTQADIDAKIEAAIKDATTQVEQRAQCARTLDTELSKSGLPEKTVVRIGAQFSGRIFKPEDLQAAIKDEKDYLAAMNVPGFDLPDQGRISGGVGMMQRVQMGLDKAFGLTADDIKTLNDLERMDGQAFFAGPARMGLDAKDFSDAVPVGGIRELYTMLTGDTDVTGRFNRSGLPADFRASQDITSATFSYVLGNTLARRLVADYKSYDFGEDLLISMRKPVRDFRNQEAVKVGYFPDLATVDPETEDYQEIAGVTDEENTYSILQKGNILTVTRKLIINDDLSLVMRLISRLGRAARRTHAKYVWNFFKDNATCSDGTAWFTSGHGNLGATAMSFATVLTAYLALAKMTEKDSGERIGLLENGVMPNLVYPVDLMSTAEKIVNDDHYFSSDDLTTKTRNPVKGKIRGRQVGLLTDANDWGLLMPPSEVDMVEMGYLNGRQEPEMFVADSPQAEQVFVADKIRHKIRFEFAGAVIDYVSGYKAVVA